MKNIKKSETLEEQINSSMKAIVSGEKSDMQAMFENLDSDIVDEQTGMTTADFIARLSRDEINASVITDELTRQGILPSISITRQKKRASVALDGLGRREKVELAQSRNEQQEGMGAKMTNWFKRQP